MTACGGVTLEVAGVPWEQSAAELSLNEELAVEQRRGRVKWRARDRGVDLIRSGDRVPECR